jgi:hypothetical protein
VSLEYVIEKAVDKNMSTLDKKYEALQSTFDAIKLKTESIENPTTEYYLTKRYVETEVIRVETILNADVI